MKKTIIIALLICSSLFGSKTYGQGVEGFYSGLGLGTAIESERSVSTMLLDIHAGYAINQSFAVELEIDLAGLVLSEKPHDSYLFYGIEVMYNLLKNDGSKDFVPYVLVGGGIPIMYGQNYFSLGGRLGAGCNAYFLRKLSGFVEFDLTGIFQGANRVMVDNTQTGAVVNHFMFKLGINYFFDYKFK